MTLPLFQFRDRLGEPVNLSTAESREEITKAELYHVIDVGDGYGVDPARVRAVCIRSRSSRCWRPLDSAHPERVPTTSYPALHASPATALWAKRSSNVGSTTAHACVFAPEDTRDPAEITDKPDAESAPACLVETLATYCQYRQIGDLGGLRQRHPNLARVVGEDDAGRAKTTDEKR